MLTKIHKKYEQYRTLQKTKSRRDQNQISKETSFKESLDDLFDIAHDNAMKMITIAEDRAFLQAQREKGRRGYIGGVHKKTVEKQEKKRKRDEEESWRIEAELRRKQNLSVVQLASSSSSNNSTENSSDEAEPGPSNPLSRKKSKSEKVKVISPDLVAALDRTKMNDRNAMMVISATASALGKYIDDITVSRNTL